MKHWVFDLDGTLINSCGLYDVAIEKILKHFGVACTPEMIALCQNYFVPDDYFRLYMPESQIADAVAMLMRFSHEGVADIVAYPGTIELVRDLVARGARVSVWTGRELETSVRILDRLGFSPFVSLLVSRSCVANTKPAPDGLIKVLAAASEHEGADVVMIGDHAYDIAGARACGVGAVSVSWDYSGTRPHPLAALSDHHFYAPAELARWAIDQVTRALVP